MSDNSKKVGRPCKYNEEVQREADRYVMEWDTVDALPSRVGLCCFLGIHRDTSYEWEAQFPPFSDTLKAIDTLQERTAVNKGITGDFNSTITKLVLANHGYHERSAVDHKSSDKSMSPKATQDEVLRVLRSKHESEPDS